MFQVRTIKVHAEVRNLTRLPQGDRCDVLDVARRRARQSKRDQSLTWPHKGKRQPNSACTGAKAIDTESDILSRRAGGGGHGDVASKEAPTTGGSVDSVVPLAVGHNMASSAPWSLPTNAGVQNVGIAGTIAPAGGGNELRSVGVLADDVAEPVGSRAAGRSTSRGSSTGDVRGGAVRGGAVVEDESRNHGRRESASCAGNSSGTKSSTDAIQSRTKRAV